MNQQDHHSSQEEEKDEDEWCNVIADWLCCQLMTTCGSNGNTDLGTLSCWSKGGVFSLLV